VGVTTEPIRVPDSGRSQHLHVVAGACSVQGARRDINEDSQFVSPDMNLFIVADGMGGHAAGEVASKFAVDVLSHELAKIAVEATEAEVKVRVHAALARAHCLILEAAALNPEFQGAGTTVVFGLLVNHRLYITGVGDSRAYLIRGSSIDRLTIDDTWPDALFHLGQLSADEAKRHHMRNMLICALGMNHFDSDREKIRALDVYDGDRCLLASDGLTDAVDADRLFEIISSNANPQTAAELLVQEAVSNDAGDDVTCIVFCIESDVSHMPKTAPPLTIWQRLTSLFKPT
jgi:serine/threonine protein phosphatase PrpC